MFHNSTSTYGASPPALILARTALVLARTALVLARTALVLAYTALNLTLNSHFTSKRNPR